MNHRISKSHKRGIYTLIFILIAAAVGGILVSAQSRDGRDDGRINRVEHLGGSALYCVDQFFQPSDWYATGGIRLLSGTGQEQLFVAATLIDEVGVPLADTLLGTGGNDYGIVSLYRLPNHNFLLVGTDEHGKRFDFEWFGCRGQLSSDVNALTPASTLATTATQLPTAQPTTSPMPTSTTAPSTGTTTLVPFTATSTFVVLTATDVPTATSTFVPLTATDVPTATSTLVPLTATDVPTATTTPTDMPTPTSTPA